MLRREVEVPRRPEPRRDSVWDDVMVCLAWLLGCGILFIVGAIGYGVGLGRGHDDVLRCNNLQVLQCVSSDDAHAMCTCLQKY